MVRKNQELTDRFIQFYRNYYRDEVGRLAQKYPDESRSLYIDYNDLFTFDRGLAEGFVAQPQAMREYAEEALRLYDLPAEVSLGNAHVRLQDLPSEQAIDITNIRVRDDIVGELVTVEAYVQEASQAESVATEAAFECQRCGTVSYIPQSPSDSLEEPRECKGCERQGPFSIRTDQSEFVRFQTATVSPLPESNSDADAGVNLYLEDDIAGSVITGDRAKFTAVLLADADSSGALNYHLEARSVSHIESPGEEFWDGDYLMDGLSETIEFDAVEEFASRSRAVLQTQDMNELETRTKIITPFISLLGWRVYHPEVQLEYTADTLGEQDRADYVLLDEDSNPTVVVEAKQEGRLLDPHENQLKRYMRNFGANFGILTNGGSFHFFITDIESDSPDEINIVNSSLRGLSGNLRILGAYSRDSQIDGDESQKLRELAQQQSEEARQTKAESVQQERREAMIEVVEELEDKEEPGAPIDEAIENWVNRGFQEVDAKAQIKNLRVAGELYEPVEGYVRTT